MKEVEIILATDQDVDKLIPVMIELRPHRSPAELREMILTQMKNGYQVVYAGDEVQAFAVGGFRTIDFLFSGKTLYVDDLVTHSQHRKKGYAGMLMKWMIQYAKENNYDHFSLDSGHQRKDAHRLYLNHGLDITAHHFGKDVKDLK
ncbi:MAG: GNAT family N-acetyltransferase [Saprospiraceae bacterium]|nr:GNAT family N-acetyltransferase [Candidatus Opimibacter skivensis]MBP6681318.1 GNAT family N-acetyltransferase [Saprospiraceae bacterium]